MPWYPRVQRAINTLLLSVLLPTQATNLALLVSALLAKRTLCLSELARAYPRPAPHERRVPRPKHDLLHRLKRLSRFLGNARVDALAVQVGLIPTTVAALGRPRILGLTIDWTYFESRLPTGAHIRYQVLRIAIPRRGRALPLVQLAYDWDALPAGQSQNQLEEAALLAVIRALPVGVRPVILADRGFARATCLEWLQEHHLDYVVRIDKGTCITEPDGRRWKLGEEGLCQGDLRFHPLVRYGLFHGRPRDVWTHLALTWRLPRHQQPDRPPRRRHLPQAQPEQPWYLATNLPTAAQAVAWYRQRFWIEESFSDSKSRFRLKYAQISCPQRLTRLLMALTIALCWLALFALPDPSCTPCPRASRAFRAGPRPSVRGVRGGVPAPSASPSSRWICCTIFRSPGSNQTLDEEGRHARAGPPLSATHGWTSPPTRGGPARITRGPRPTLPPPPQPTAAAGPRRWPRGRRQHTIRIACDIRGGEQDRGKERQPPPREAHTTNEAQGGQEGGRSR